MHFDFVTLRAFLMVADAENLRAASEQLNLSVSAVSRRISDLEADLGQQLFVRHSRGLEITEAGRLLMARARDTFRTLRTIEDDMKRLETGARRESLHLRQWVSLGQWPGQAHSVFPGPVR